jgi:phosphatidylserine/phosphatidylglycerophosphate/cardiolipin synthase-like enzyme
MKTLSIRAALQLGGATSILNHLVGKFTIDGTLSLRKVVESVQSALERFFLDEVASKDLFFRGAHRLSCAVEPLIDRAHALEAMERSILEAQSTVFIAGWLFLPETPLLDPDVRKIIGKEFDLLKGIKVSWPLTWLSLIRFVLEKKGVAVKVRIIITDFDGFFLNLTLVKKVAGRFFPMVDQIKSIIAEYNKMKFSLAISRYRRTPGHWGSIRVDLAKKRFSLGSSPEPRAFIASHHQKFCVVDGKIAFCGGMDVTPLALDTMRHERSRSNWHDIHSLIKGMVVTDIERGSESVGTSKRLPSANASENSKRSSRTRVSYDSPS